MQTILKKNITISTYSVDADGNVRVPMLCYYMQDIASEHANALQVGFHHLIEQNRIWVLTALRLKVNNYPRWNTKLSLATWPTHKERFYYYRDFEFKNDTGNTMAIGSTQWIVLDLKTRRPARSELSFEHAFHDRNRVFDKAFEKIKLPDKEPEYQSHIVHYLDLDINNHVNNVRYVEWIFQSLSSEYLKKNQLAQLQIHFLTEAQMNQTVHIKTLEETGYSLIHTIDREEDAKEVIRAATVWRAKK